MGIAIFMVIAMLMLCVERVITHRRNHGKQVTLIPPGVGRVGR